MHIREYILILRYSAIRWREISVIAYNDCSDHSSLLSFAIMLPHAREYRVVHVSWDFQIPFIEQSSLIAMVEPLSQPCLSIVNVQALRPDVYDLLIHKRDLSLCLVSGSQTFSLGLSYKQQKGRAVLQLSWIGDDASPIPAREQVQVVGIYKNVDSSVMVQVSSGELHDVSFNLIPHNRLTNEILQTLQFVLPTPDFNSLRRRQLQRWFSEDQSTELQAELDCLWTALFEVIGCDNRPVYSHPTLPPKQVFNQLVHCASHRRLMDDPILAGFRLPQQPRASTPLVSTLSPLAEPVILGLHLLGQAYKISTVRSIDLEYLSPALLRLSRVVVPNWTDYWSRMCPDSDEAWHAPVQGKPISIP